MAKKSKPTKPKLTHKQIMQRLDLIAKDQNDTIKVHNKKIIEDRLKKILSDVCKQMRTEYAEWDTDEYLYRAVLNHTNRNLPKVIAAFDTYDVLCTIAKELGVELNPQFEWFFEFNKPKNS